VVHLESSAGTQPETTSETSHPVDAAVDERSRVELLEARVEALEAALRDLIAPGRTGSTDLADDDRKLVWLDSEAGHASEFSAERGTALFHNLGGVKTQAIAIRTPVGDDDARANAEWFKSIFERAGWTVRGPAEVTRRAAAAGLSLAVPDLPVGKDAAATWFALKAAGFEPMTVLDEALGGSGEEATAMALTVPPVKAA
jgi:hypothetical protein